MCPVEISSEPVCIPVRCSNIPPHFAPSDSQTSPAFLPTNEPNRPMRILAVTNAYPTREAPASGAFIEQQIVGLRQIGLRVDLLFINRAQKGMWAYLGVAQKVRQAIASFNCDVVHVMYGGVMADEIVRKVREIPVIVSFCGSDLLGENLSGTTRKLISKYGISASHRAAKRAAGIVVKSDNLYAALPNDLDFAKVRIIPNGVDLQLFKPLDRSHCRRQLGWSDDAFHVLFPTNSGDPCKRFWLASRAVDKLGGSGIPTEIHQLCGVPHDKVPIWLNASNVLLLTSAQEGSPNIVKEALACNVPIVAVDVGDVRQRIGGVDGCYLATPDPKDLAFKLQMVLQSRRRISGRSKVEELSLPRIACQLKNLYEGVRRSTGSWASDHQ